MYATGGTEVKAVVVQPVVYLVSIQLISLRIEWMEYNILKGMLDNTRWY